MVFKELRTIVIIIFLTVIIISGCGGEEASPSFNNQAEEPAREEQTAAPVPEQDNNAGSADEVLFDFYSTPPDWPRAVPSMMNEYRATLYERTESSMHVAGYGDLNIGRANNFYHNAIKKEGNTSFKWEFDPVNPSITEGPEQIFNLTDDEGRTLIVIIKEVESNKIEFDLRYTE